MIQNNSKQAVNDISLSVNFEGEKREKEKGNGAGTEAGKEIGQIRQNLNLVFGFTDLLLHFCVD